MIPPIRRYYRKQLIAWFHRTFKIQTNVGGESVRRSEVIDTYVVEKGDRDEDVT
jgi:hypothetical protein